MSDPADSAYVARLARRALSQGRGSPDLCGAVLNFLWRHESALDLELPRPLVEALDSGNKREARLRQALPEHLPETIARLERVEAAGARPDDDGLCRNIAWLGADLGLSALDREVLEAVLRYPHLGILESLLDDLSPKAKGYPRTLALVLGVAPRQLQQRLAPAGLLAGSGLLTVNSTGYYLASHDADGTDYLTVAPLARQALHGDHDSGAALREAIFGKPLPASLSWADFEHLGQTRDLVAGVLKGAMAEAARGVNILLYGPPGCGKTEFFKTLAAHLGLSLFTVAEVGRDGGELGREARLQELCFLQRLAASRGDAVLLFDEMEDLEFAGLRNRAGRRIGSKIFLNRMLESNPVPVLWTSNEIWDVDPALLRRMSLVIELDLPGLRARQRLWRRVVAERRIEARPDDLQRLAAQLEVAPGLAAKALRTVELAGGDLADVEQVIQGVAKAMRGGRKLPPLRRDETVFDLAMTNADLDLEALIDRVAAGEGARAFSLCLYGPPGTGKSAFARHLAECLGLRAMKKRVSDLFSMWIGGTEKRIAAAFERAVEDEALLIFDEADALLAPRAGAGHSWEISQVAEMLTWMEVHPLPFCCTTNLVERLDPASLRRFTFKVRFDYLTPGQVNYAFRVFFGRHAPAPVLALANLTPGDFATVRRKALILGLQRDLAALAEMLAQESAAKPDSPRPIGFLAPAAERS